MSEEKGLVKTQEGLPALTRGSLFFDSARFAHAKEVAKMLAASTMVPEHFRGGQGVGNCIIALNLAERMGVDPFMLMQNMYVIHGRPGIEAKLAIALINGCERFEPLQYRQENRDKGDAWQCIAFAKDLKSNIVLESVPVSIKMAKDEGWYNKPGSKWKTMPELMLEYRSAMFFARVYCPEVLLGLKTREELYDIVELEKTSNGMYATAEERAADLTEQIKNGALGTAPVVKYEAEDIPPATTVDPGAAQDLVGKLAAGDHEISGYGATDLTQGDPGTDNGTKNGWYGDLLKARPGASDNAKDTFEKTIRDNLEAIYNLPKDQREKIITKWKAVFDIPFPVVASDDDSDLIVNGTLDDDMSGWEATYPNFMADVLRSQKRAVDQKRTNEFWELMGNLGYDSDTWRDALEDDREEMVKALQKRFGG